MNLVPNRKYFQKYLQSRSFSQSLFSSSGEFTTIAFNKKLWTNWEKINLYNRRYNQLLVARYFGKLFSESVHSIEHIVHRVVSSNFVSVKTCYTYFAMSLFFWKLSGILIMKSGPYFWMKVDRYINHKIIEHRP